MWYVIKSDTTIHSWTRNEETAQETADSLNVINDTDEWRVEVANTRPDSDGTNRL